MGQDLSQLTENVPNLLGSALLKIGQEVAMDLHESSMQDLFEGGGNDDDGGDDVIVKEEEMAQRMTMASPRYLGIWQDEKGRPFYYDVEHRAYFFLENPQASNIACQKEYTSSSPSPPPPPTKTNNSFHHHNLREEEKEEESSSSSSPLPPQKQSPSSTVTPSAVSHFRVITDKIMTDLHIIYSNVTHSVSRMLERGEGLEQTRQKLKLMMDISSSIERQTRCLSCAHRCNAILPGTGFTFIMKIADMIPMSACCQDDGICGPYVYMSEDESGDIELDEFQHDDSIPDNLTDCHLE